MGPPDEPCVKLYELPLIVTCFGYETKISLWDVIDRGGRALFEYIQGQLLYKQGVFSHLPRFSNLFHNRAYIVKEIDTQNLSRHIDCLPRIGKVYAYMQRL